MRVFVSYRRGDAAAYAGRLTDALVQRLGQRGVFQDVAAIDAGQDYGRAIDEALRASDVVLAVIGPGWSSARTSRGSPRLLEPDDYVRKELADALVRGGRVVPVLVGGASLPSRDELPADLHPLLDRQAVALRDESWHADVDDLLRELRGERPPAPRPRRVLVLAAGVAVLALAAGASAWWSGTGGSGGGATRAQDAAGGGAAIVGSPTGNEEDGEPPPCAPPEGEEWQSLALNESAMLDEPVEKGQLTYRVEEARSRRSGQSWEVVVRTSMTNATSEAVYHGHWHYEHLIVGQRAFPPACYSEDDEVVDPGVVGDALLGFVVRCEPTGYIELAVDDRRLPVTKAAGGWGRC